jgi:hypothetical protein
VENELPSLNPAVETAMAALDANRMRNFALIVFALSGLGVIGGEPGPVLRNVATESGLVFRFETGSRNKHDLPEIMGGGVALIDVDGDGLLDVYFCNGGPIVADSKLADPPCRLFRNRGHWRFEEITSIANAPGPSYAMGAAVGDFDGDGRNDLFVTGWRDQRLYRNLGDGRFADVTVKSGLSSKLWSTAAAFADLDGDGDLDLYVCNYLDYDPAKAPFCAAPDGKQDYCGPEEFDAQPDRLYRNNGDGTFTDVAKEAGIMDTKGRGLGVLIADLVGDSKPDLFVANDGTACYLLENRGDLKFVDVAQKSGVAFDGDGRALAGMGVACGDIDGDGRIDLLASNFLGRSTVAFLSQGDGLFSDASAAVGLTSKTRSVLGFGLGLEDFDGDGNLDLIQANGHVLDRARLGEPLAMKPLFLRNEGKRFRDGAAEGGATFSQPILGRGVAVGDLDNDGRPDVVIASLDSPAIVLRNEGKSGRWLTLEMLSKANRPAIGATVRRKQNGRSEVRPVVGGGSYLSASDRRIRFVRSELVDIDQVEVTWPWGRRERFRIPANVSLVRLRQGTGVEP